MFIYNISRVVIANYNKPLGIITDKDIAWYLYTEIPNRRLDQVGLNEIMSKNLITVGEHANLQLCAKLMLENKISSILVVDNNKQDLKGIITKSLLENSRGFNIIKKGTEIHSFWYKGYIFGKGDNET